MPWEPATYGDRIAEVYDDWYDERAFDGGAAVERLVALAGGGRVLELGIGTGRLALRLAGRGLEVHGIDASAAMVERLRAKPGGNALAVTIADFTDVPVEGRFELVAAAFNTFFNLTSADAQRRCFAAVAQHLAPHGRFVVEAFVPRPDAPTSGLELRRVTDDAVHFHAFRTDPGLQLVVNQTIALSAAGMRLYPSQLRWAPPTELDAMAGAAGLSLEHRWGGWSGDAFTDESPTHVSVYRRPSAEGSVSSNQ